MSSRQVVGQQWSSLQLLPRKLFILHPAQETSGKIFSLKMGQIVNVNEKVSHTLMNFWATNDYEKVSHAAHE